MATFDTWNQADKNASITLTLSNLKATSGANYANVRGALGKSSGKHYFEYTVNAINTGGGGVGKSNATLGGAGAFPGSDANGWAAIQSGIYNNNTLIDSTTFAIGDVIMVAIDIGAGKLWFGKNGTWLASGDPGAGTNPMFSGLSGTFYPYGGGGNTTAITANFGASAFAYTVPSGFNAGWYTPTSTSVTATAGSYSLTGAATTLGRLFRVVAASGAYAITGFANTIRKSISIVASKGSYSVSGAAAVIGKRLRITVNAGAYALVGAAATMRRGYRMPMSPGAYLVTGKALIGAFVDVPDALIRKTKFVLQKLRSSAPKLDQ